MALDLRTALSSLLQTLRGLCRVKVELETALTATLADLQRVRDELSVYRDAFDSMSRTLAEERGIAFITRERAEAAEETLRLVWPECPR